MLAGTLLPLVALAMGVLVLGACSHKSPEGPTSALQPFKRGVQAYEDEDYPRAAKQFQQAADLDDSSANIYYNLGLAYYQLEAYPEAIEAYHKALKLDPKAADVHMNLALAYDRTFELELANSEYNEYLALVRASKPKDDAAGKGTAAAGASAAVAKQPKPVLPGQALSTLPGGPQPKKPGDWTVQPRKPGDLSATQSGRSRPNAVPPNGGRAPISELRRAPADTGKPPIPRATRDSNSSEANEWWTQDTLPKIR